MSLWPCFLEDKTKTKEVQGEIIHKSKTMINANNNASGANTITTTPAVT